MSSSFAARLAAPFREFGALDGALYLLDRLLSAATRSMRLQAYDLVVQPIPTEDLRDASAAKGLEVRVIASDAPELQGLPVRPEVLASRLRQECICLGAFRRGVLIGYMWVSPDRYEEDEVRCRYDVYPKGQAVFDFDFFLYPEHRMGRGFVGLWHGANRYLRERGVRYTFSRLTRFNVASRRAHARFGCRRIGSAVFLTSRRLQFMLGTVAPFVHVCTRSSGGPTLRLTPDERLSARTR